MIMQVSSPESTTITIADHTFHYIGELTQHDDGGFTLHIDNLARRVERLQGLPGLLSLYCWQK
jgi:hypothetical protein